VELSFAFSKLISSQLIKGNAFVLVNPCKQWRMDQTMKPKRQLLLPLLPAVRCLQM